jgi:tetratricopeptide (TPR) repeat protein
LQGPEKIVNKDNSIVNLWNAQNIQWENFMKDWYRRKSWTKSDEEDFFKKLNRARKDGRAQYLKIQAIELVETKDKVLLKVAEDLLNKMLTEYPDDDFNKGGALCTLGDIYKFQEDYKQAISYYKQALDFEKVYPNVITEAYLDYSELVVKTGDTTSFDEVEQVLLERQPDLIFPIQKYKVNALLSIINKHKNNHDKAKYFADLAEQSASAENSGLRYHKYLGVVTERDEWLEKNINK